LNNDQRLWIPNFFNINHPIQKNKIIPLTVRIVGVGSSMVLMEPAYAAMIATGMTLISHKAKNFKNGMRVMPAIQAKTSGKIGVARESSITIEPC